MYYKDTKPRQVSNENTNATQVILAQTGLGACFAVFRLYFSGTIFNYAFKNTFLYVFNFVQNFCNGEKKEKLECFLFYLL